MFNRSLSTDTASHNQRLLKKRQQQLRNKTLFVKPKHVEKKKDSQTRKSLITHRFRAILFAVIAFLFRTGLFKHDKIPKFNRADDD